MTTRTDMSVKIYFFLALLWCQVGALQGQHFKKLSKEFSQVSLAPKATYLSEKVAFYESRTIQKKRFSPIEKGGMLRELAYLQEKLSNRRKAIELEFHALSYFRQSRSATPMMIADAHSHLSALYRDFPKYDSALIYADSAYQTLYPVRFEHSLMFMSSLINLAEAYRFLNNFDISEKLYLDGAQFINNHYDPKNPWISTMDLELMKGDMKNNLAHIYAATNRLDQAIETQKELVESRLKLIGPNNGKTFGAKRNLALHYMRKGLFEEAEAVFYKEGMALWQSGKPYPGNYGYAHFIIGYADVCLGLKRFAQAEEYYRTAVELHKENLGENSNHYQKATLSLGKFLFETDRYTEALPLLSTFSTTRLALAKRTGPNIGDESLRTLISGIYEEMEPFFQLATACPTPELANTLFDFNIGMRSIRFNAWAQVAKMAKSGGDPQLAALYQDWLARSAALNDAYKLTPAQQRERQVNLNLMGAELDRVERQLLTAARLEVPELGFASVQGRLKQGEAALDILRFQRQDSVHYLVLCLTPETRDAPHLLNIRQHRQQEEQLLAWYHEAVASCATGDCRDLDGERPTASSYEEKAINALYDAYWRPIQHALDSLGADARQIYLTTDGAYQRIALGVLRAKGDSAYLLDRTALHYLNSLRDIPARESQKRTEKSGMTALLLGRPAYPGVEASSIGTAASRLRGTLVAGEGWPDLPGSEEEVVVIGGLLQSSGHHAEVFVGRQATKSKLSERRAPDILHIAAHAFYRTSERSASARKGQELLSRVGLLLASDVSPEQGALSGLEAQSLDLVGTELVVLSACQTGIGDKDLTEGMMGLQRVFLMAGARSVMVSLWSVDDAVTARLMQRFYREWLSGAHSEKREALAAAQRAIRDEHPHPFFWGGFTLLGE